MKILVLGATGMAGHLISLYFMKNNYDVTTFTTRTFPYCKNIVGDVFNIDYLKEILLNGEYDVVINCVGILNQFAENNISKAIFLNAYLPHFIADVLRNTSTKLIHMSTDCVFSGNTGPYFEDSYPDGRTVYDRTKALGEVNDDKNLTFRNSIIGPDMKSDGIGLFNWFMKQQEETTVYGYTNAIWTGVTTLTLAKAMEQAIKDNISGLYNLVNNTSISKYDLLILFNDVFRNGKIDIKKSDSFVLDKSLYHKRADFSFAVPSYEQMIAEMKEWIDVHKDIYPNYYK